MPKKTASNFKHNHYLLFKVEVPPATSRLTEQLSKIGTSIASASSFRNPLKTAAHHR